MRAITGTISYTSNKPERKGEVRGIEHFRIDIYDDGERTTASHCEIDDKPRVVRDVNLRINSARRPVECFVRIAVGGKLRGAGFFRFGESFAKCDTQSNIEGSVFQQLELDAWVPAFGNHAMINDGFLMSLYDRNSGPGVQVIPRMLLSSPDHRGATGPMLFCTDVAIEYVGDETIDVKAGAFDASHYRIVGVPGLPVEHPSYDLWCTADSDHVLLKAHVGGYMQTYYELVALSVIDRIPLR